MFRNLLFWGVPCALLVGCLFLGYGGDYRVYRHALQSGADEHYYYPYYFLFILAPFGLLPHAIGYGLWSLANTLALRYASRVFSPGRTWLMSTLQFALAIYLGQATGLLALGMALGYRYHRRQPWLAGVGVALLLIKPHLGLPLVLILLAHSQRRDLPKLLLPTALLMLGSFAVWGWWVAVVLEHLRETPPGYINPIWQMLGVGAGLLWLPIALLPNLSKRLQFATLCLFLTMPYARPYDMLLMYLFYGGVPLLGNLQILGGGQNFCLGFAGLLYGGMVGQFGTVRNWTWVQRVGRA